jgi:hypothetical protein
MNRGNLAVALLIGGAMLSALLVVLVAVSALNIVL